MTIIMLSMEQTMEVTTVDIMDIVEEIPGSMHFTVSTMIPEMEGGTETARNVWAREVAKSMEVWKTGGLSLNPLWGDWPTWDPAWDNWQGEEKDWDANANGRFQNEVFNVFNQDFDEEQMLNVLTDVRAAWRTRKGKGKDKGER